MSYLPFEIRRIIDGKRYATEKANEIGYHSENFPGNFRFVEEGLFQTPRSKLYFLAGRGGPSTKYAESLGDGQGYSGGSAIFPLSENEAFKWAQQYLDTDEVEELFGDHIQDA